MVVSSTKSQAPDGGSNANPTSMTQNHWTDAASFSNAPLPSHCSMQGTNHATVSDIHLACASVRPDSDIGSSALTWELSSYPRNRTTGYLVTLHQVLNSQKMTSFLVGGWLREALVTHYPTISFRYNGQHCIWYASASTRQVPSPVAQAQLHKFGRAQ
jgi:hypothetical protein